MSPNNVYHEEKFVGRQNELAQFEQAIKLQNKLKGFLKLGIEVQPRVFLPYGIGGIGKTWLSRECLRRAKKAGWKIIEINWEKVDLLPVDETEMMDTISQFIKQEYGEKIARDYLKARQDSKQVVEKVSRLKQENQEKWLSIVDTTKDLVEVVGGDKGKPVGAIISATGKAVNVLAGELAKAEELFVGWLTETAKLGIDEKVLYTNKNKQLAQKLVLMLKDAASEQALAIFFDTCEVLSAELEEWLRDAVTCPAIETGSSFMFIISGRQDQYHERQITTESGTKRTVKGYADRLSSPSPIPWDISRFSDPEIKDYLANFGIDPKPELIEFVQSTARGVPYAVQLVTAGLLKLGVEALKEKFPPDADEFSPQEMLTQVTRRFLRYCMENDDDLKLVQGLAVLRSWDEGSLMAIWKLPDNIHPNKVLQRLEVRYGFVLPDRRLHEIVRDFVREDLRITNETTARSFGTLAKNHYFPLWEKINTDIPVLAERVAEPRWRNISIDTLNALFWHNEQEALKFLTSRFIESISFDANYASSLLAITNDFSKPEGWCSTRSHRIINILRQTLDVDDKNQKQNINYFLSEVDTLALGGLHKALLQLLLIRVQYREGEYLDALQSCLDAKSEASSINDSSVNKLLSEEFSSIGWKLGWERGMARPSDEALLALEHSISLQPNEGHLHIGMGVMQYGLKNYNEAAKSIEYGIKIGEERSWAYNWLGNVYSDLKQYQDAINAYNKAMELDPKDAAPWNGLGNVYLDLKQYQDAINAHNKAIELDPKDATPWNNLGIVYRNLKQYQDAINACNKAIELDPKDAAPWNNLGILYRDLKQYQDAINAYNKAMELDPKDAAPWNGLGILYRNLKQYQDAINAHNKAMELDPKDAAPWNGLGNVYLDLKQYQDAINAYNKAMELDPKNATPWNNLGIVYLDLKQYQDAINAYNKAIELDPKDAAPWNGLGNVYSNLKQYQDAINAYNKAMELDPKDAAPWNGLGNVYSDLKQYQDAINAHNKAMELDPKDAAPWNGLGNVYLDLKQYQDAINAHNKAIELDPKAATPWNGLGNVYLDLKQYQDAINACNKAIELDPKDAAPWYQLGLIYSRAGDIQNSLKSFEQAVILIGNDGSYRASYARVLKLVGNIEEAEKQIEAARELLEDEDTYNRACFEAICGNADEALKLLQKAIEEGQDREWVRFDPDWEILREDERFKELVGED